MLDPVQAPRSELPDGREYCVSKANAKSGSGQGGGQNPGLASDAVAQQPDGHILVGILLKRAQHVQCGPAQDAHHGGRVPRAHAAVVLPELHIQGAVQAVLDPPVAADECL